MMLTFMIVSLDSIDFQSAPRWVAAKRTLSLEACQRCHYLIGDRLHHFLQIGGFRGPRMAILFLGVKSMRFGNEFAVTALKDAVAAQVAVFAAKARIVVTEPFLDVEQLLRLPFGEIVH